MNINIGELSKPATVLIEKIADAIGGVFKPNQIVRVAKAEAEAELIRAEAQIQITDLHRRAFYRFLDEEAKRQANIEEITRQALPQLDPKSEPEGVENDWITNFFDKCRLISDADMQRLWARVLAGEANAPGSYSKRTVNFLSTMDKGDADLFTKLCTFVWTIDEATPLVFDFWAELYNKYDITRSSLSHLDSIGIVHFDSLQRYGASRLPKQLTVFYHRQPVFLELPKESDNTLDLGHVILTKVGQELAPICGATPDSEFRVYVLKVWKQMGYLNEDKTEQSTAAEG